jgi:uncharacterized membrane protein YcgQ (UPF0703/DUF1980 family)
MIFTGCERKASEQAAQDLTTDLSLPDSSTGFVPTEPVSQSAPEPTPRESTDGAKKKNADGGVVEIKEKMFIAQTNDIYINKDDYIGKTIKYEGIFDESVWPGNGKTYRYVIRFGPGCCPGDAAAAGFEVAWNKDYPQKNDWVEAAGVLEEYIDGGTPNIRIALTSLKVLQKRGKERVSQ